MRIAPRITAMLATALVLLCTVAPAAQAASAPVRNPACRASLSAAEKAELIALSDTGSIKTFADAAPRISRIKQILLSRKDNRATFAIFYDNIMKEAVPAVAKGTWDDPKWVERVSRFFVIEYLDNLRGHLTGGPVTASWQRHFTLAAQCDRTVGRTISAALTAHLVIDLPVALQKAGTTTSATRDYFAIGDALIAATPKIVAEIKASFGQDLSELFRLYWFGQAVDGMAGKPITTPVFFQSVRFNAWMDGLYLGQPALVEVTRSSMKTKWKAADGMLDAMERYALI